MFAARKSSSPPHKPICDDLSPKDRLSPIDHASMVKDNHTQLPKQNIIQQQNHCSWRAFVHWSNSEFPEGEVPAKYLSKANLTLGQTVPVSPFRNLTMPFLNPCTSTSLLLWGNTFEVIITSQNRNILHLITFFKDFSSLFIYLNNAQFVRINHFYDQFRNIPITFNVKTRMCTRIPFPISLFVALCIVKYNKSE